MFEQFVKAQADIIGGPVVEQEVSHVPKLQT